MRTFITVALCLLAGAVVLAVLFAIEDMILPPLAMSMGHDWIREIPLASLVFFGVLMLPGRWTALPIAYRIHAETTIDVSPDAVWDLIAPRNRDAYWSASITGTTVPADAPNRLDFHFEGSEDIGAPAVLETEIVAVEPHRYFAYRPLNGDKFPLFAGDLILSEYYLEDLGDQTRVTVVENLDRLRLVAIPLLLWMNPCRDALVRLKATCEGRPDTSWMGKTAEDLREDDGTLQITGYGLLKWFALAMLPLAFTLFLISAIGFSGAP